MSTPKRPFRVEIEDTVTTIRQAWFQATSEEDAREQAEAEDWRTFEVIETQADCNIVNVEDCEKEEAR